MRKLKLQMQMSLDGFVCGLNGELDWMVWNWDEKLQEDGWVLTNSFDTIMMGSGMADGFTAHWEGVVNSNEGPELEAAKIFVDTPKIVFSKKLSSVKGKNIVVENGDLVEVVTKLKSMPGKDIIVYGGAGFVSSLIKNSLIDELYLFINPTAIGEGKKIFSGKHGYELVASKSYSCGIVVNQYSPENK
jgi:dihydrofolate reductase